MYQKHFLADAKLEYLEQFEQKIFSMREKDMNSRQVQHIFEDFVFYF